MSLIEILKTKL